MKRAGRTNHRPSRFVVCERKAYGGPTSIALMTAELLIDMKKKIIDPGKTFVAEFDSGPAVRSYQLKLQFDTSCKTTLQR